MNRKIILRQVEQMVSVDRNKTHGDPMKQLALATELKNLIGLTDTECCQHLTDVEKEALSSILTKCSRIVTGTPTMDHWQDIAGYAAISAESRSKQKIKDED